MILISKQLGITKWKILFDVAEDSTRKNIKRIRGKLSKGILFMQDNAPAHNSYVAMPEFMVYSANYTTPLFYSSNLAPFDYLSKRRGDRRRGGQFYLARKNFLLKDLETLQVRCNRCIDLRGEYVKQKKNF